MPSYSPVFSQGFIYYTGATPNTSFDVPDGFTAVLREVDVYTAAGFTEVSLFIQDSLAAPAVYVLGIKDLGANSSDQWTGRIVVPGGGAITINISELGFYDGCYVGGYLLRNTLT